MIVTFIPAAGASSRMRGVDKLLEPIDGVAILRRTAIEALGAELGPVVVGVKPTDRARRNALRNLPIEVVEVPDAAQGMSAALKVGAAEALRLIGKASSTGGDDEYFGMMILLPDMPGIRRADLKAMDIAFQSSGGPFVRAVSPDGDLGHPVLFPDWSLRQFEALEGDRGAFSVIGDEHVVRIPLPADRATRDLDTPEDWAAWRAEHES